MPLTAAGALVHTCLLKAKYLPQLSLIKESGYFLFCDSSAEGRQLPELDQELFKNP